MIVIHTYPTTGNRKILFNSEVRFPDGPLSDTPEDMIEFLEWNIEQLKNMAKNMTADAKRQQVIAEISTEQAALGEIRRKLNKSIAMKLDKSRQ